MTLKEILKNACTQWFSNAYQEKTISCHQIPPDLPITTEVLRWLEQQKLLKLSNRICGKRQRNGNDCEDSLSLHPSKLFKADTFELRCPTHKESRSIRENSFFDQREFSIPTVISIVHYLSIGFGIENLIKLFHPEKFDEQAYMLLLRQLQIRMQEKLENHRPAFDQSDEVEIGEIRVKEENSLGKGQLIIGVINRTKTKFWIQILDDHQKPTRQRFLDSLFTGGPPTIVKGNLMKSQWNRLRSLLRARNAHSNMNDLPLHLAEYMYKFHRFDWFDLIRN